MQDLLLYTKRKLFLPSVPPAAPEFIRPFGLEPSSPNPELQYQALLLIAHGARGVT